MINIFRIRINNHPHSKIIHDCYNSFGEPKLNRESEFGLRGSSSISLHLTSFHGTLSYLCYPIIICLFISLVSVEDELKFAPIHSSFDEMELSNFSIDSLDILLNTNIVSDEHFERLLSSSAVLTKIGKVNGKYTSEIDTKDTSTAGIIYGNIFGLFVEAARHRYDTEHFINFLRSSKIFGGPRAERLALVYGEQREQLISQLTSTGNNLPCIVDISWELDYCINNSTNGSIGSWIYHIRLITKKHGILDHVQFTCTRHQLQELIYKLRDAIRHMEKLSRI